MLAAREHSRALASSWVRIGCTVAAGHCRSLAAHSAGTRLRHDYGRLQLAAIAARLLHSS